eukprot:Hpha_TRINITY_DN9182_c0_g1::TRINITY_DN9182_c0_g1_i1::g.94655::m.94655
MSTYKPYAGRPAGKENPFGSPSPGNVFASGGAPRANPFEKPAYNVSKPKAGPAGAKSDSTPSALLSDLGTEPGQDLLDKAGGEEACFLRLFQWLPTRIAELERDERKAAADATSLVLSSLTRQHSLNDAVQRRVSRAYFGLQQTKDLLTAHCLQEADRAFQQLETRGFSMFGESFGRLGPEGATVEMAKAEELSWDLPPASVVAAVAAARKRSSPKIDGKWFSSCFGGGGGEVQTEKETVNLKCPFMMKRIRDPARSTKCTPHLGATDLIASIVVARQQGKPPPCPHCEGKLHESDLVIDPLLAKILKAVPQNVTAIELSKDGKWKAVEFETGDDDDDSGSD